MERLTNYIELKSYLIKIILTRSSHVTHFFLQSSLNSITFPKLVLFMLILNDDPIYNSGRKSQGTLVYQAGHNLLKSHAMAYRLYDEKYRSTQHGKSWHF